MVTFTGIDHVAFTVTDLDRSEAFYTELFGFVAVMDIGYGRICMHPGTGFVLTVVTHAGAPGGDFTETTTGLDHLGLAAGSREELEEWERRFEEMGVPYTPIRDEPLGHILNFRDPDNIALDLSAPTEAMQLATAALRAPDVTVEQIDEYIALVAGPEFVVKRR
jgi:catechol 2,3-dioxygenase-like lactoylglutathione lyase family enzyme